MSNLMVKYKVVKSSPIRDYLLELLDKEWDNPKGEDYGNIKRVKWPIQSLNLNETVLDQDLLNEPRFKKDIQKRVEFQRNNIFT